MQQQTSPSPASTGATGTATTAKTMVNGGRFDFDDGGTYCGGWEDGKAHGHGVCTGPKGQGAYSGSWHFGFEVSGVYTWPSGSSFEGQWQNGKRHGLGVEARGRWLYRGEWTQGFKGRYGVRQSATSTAKYEGTWANGLQDGYGSETYADSGTYQGQWLRGMRHGYGVRASAPFGLASHYRPGGSKAIRASMTSLRSAEPGAAPGDPAAASNADRDRRAEESRGGFVLKARSDEPPPRRGSLTDKSSKGFRKVISGLKLKHRSASDLDKRGTSASIRSTGSTTSWVSTESSQSAMTSASVHTDSNASFVVEDEQLDAGVTETYMGEWKNDKRAGFGISERSDGLRYEGEWFANKKYGYGVTTLRDGTKEEGKYKNNVLISSQKKKHVFLIRSAKFRERIDAAVNAAQRASKIALQKADIAITRTATARGKAEMADTAAEHAKEDSDIARDTAKQFAPDFHQPGLDRVRREIPKYRPPPEDALPVKSILHQPKTNEQPATQQQQYPYSQQNQMTNSNQQQQYPYSQQNQVVSSNQQQYPYSQQNQVANSNQQQQQQYPYSQQNQVLNSSQQQQYPYSQQNQIANSSQQPTIVTTEPDGKPFANKVGNAVGYEDQVQQGSVALRRNSHVKTTTDSTTPGQAFQQSLDDRFDHYKRPPSRDSSVDRYARATASARLSMARQPSVDKGLREPSVPRGATPAPALNGQLQAAPQPPQTTPAAANTIPPFEDVILRKRNLGQDIIPSPGQPKRTESLYINPAAAGGGGGARGPPAKNLATPTPIQRKKSLPDVQGLPKATDPMSREEVSVLSSARREEVRRLHEETERLRANPLLYLVSPHVKDWFSRQQLVMLVLFINVSLAIMFFKLLT